MGKFDAAISFQTSKVVEFIFRNLETSKGRNVTGLLSAEERKRHRRQF